MNAKVTNSKLHVTVIMACPNQCVRFQRLASANTPKHLSITVRRNAASKFSRAARRRRAPPPLPCVGAMAAPPPPCAGAAAVHPPPPAPNAGGTAVHPPRRCSQPPPSPQPPFSQPSPQPSQLPPAEEARAVPKVAVGGLWVVPVVNQDLLAPARASNGCKQEDLDREQAQGRAHPLPQLGPMWS